MNRSWLRGLASVLSGVLLGGAFPYWNQSYLAWVGLVPLLVAVRGLPPRLAAGYGWLTGFVFFLVTIYWVPTTISSFTTIPQIAAVGILLLMAAVAAYSYAAFSYFLERCAAAGAPRLLVAPALWVVLEWMRGFVPAEFPWNLLGYSQLEYLPMAQAADLGGVYLISAALVLANTALAEALALRGQGDRRVARTMYRAGLAVLCPLLLFVYGEWRLQQLELIPYTGAIRVGVVQGNVAQDQKWDDTLSQRIFSRYLELSEQAVRTGAELVIWPEAAVPFYLQLDQRSLQLGQFAREAGVDLLVGAPGAEDRDGTGLRPYNQAWLLRSGGEVVGPYDKIQLVPFGEYIPFRGLFGLVKVAVESIGELGRGTDYTIFETVELSAPVEASPDQRDALQRRQARFATLICYEGIFPGLTRTFAAQGPDFLVNISNDAWYGDTAAPRQHLMMAAMRSVENRLPMIRSTNTGISAFVTDEGRIGPTTALFREEVVVEKVLVREVWSFYRSYGDVFLNLCQIVVAGALLLVLRRAVNRRLQRLT